MERWCVVTTVGTSFLSNYVRDRDLELNGLIRQIANESESAVDDGTKRRIGAIADRILDDATRADSDRLKKMSAELNGLISVYGQRLYMSEKRTRDQHFLVATDTYLGRVCAELLELILEHLGLPTIVRPEFPGLTTRDYRSFTQGVSRLVEWCQQTLPPLRRPNSRVIFNLVGSFKSLQAYMNTLGMFLADEIIYIFEADDAELIRIPRLPVALDEVETLRAHLPEFGLLAHGVILDRYQADGIPEALLAPADEEGRVRLSEWGRVVWDRNSKSLLASADPLRLPETIRYEHTFLSDYRQLAVC